jgi:3',5'-cyclic AMP phosphodiesterase CpdA
VARYHGDADRIVITGDLAHHGQRESYELLRTMLSDLPVPPKLMIGNHDDRGTFSSVFSEVPTDQNGFVQYVDETPAGRFIYLDTVQAGTHSGHFDEARQAWLTAELDAARQAGAPVFLFMHHNPMPVGVKSADVIGLVQGEAFRAILRENRDIVRHIFFGHCHYILSGSVAGIPFSAPRSTCHPCVPDLENRDAVGYGPLPPTYDVCLIDEDHVVVHSIDFLADGDLKWLGLESDNWVLEPDAAE